VIRLFPNRDSGLRLIGAFFIEYGEKWVGGRKYLDMTDYDEWKQTIG